MKKKTVFPSSFDVVISVIKIQFPVKLIIESKHVLNSSREKITSFLLLCLSYVLSCF